MISPQLIRRIILIIIIAAAGFLIGYAVVHFYHQSQVEPIQNQPAPQLPS